MRIRGKIQPGYLSDNDVIISKTLFYCLKFCIMQVISSLASHFLLTHLPPSFLPTTKKTPWNQITQQLRHSLVFLLNWGIRVLLSVLLDQSRDCALQFMSTALQCCIAVTVFNKFFLLLPYEVQAIIAYTILYNLTTGRHLLRQRLNKYSYWLVATTNPNDSGSLDAF